jgi:hypothetical protein
LTVSATTLLFLVGMADAVFAGVDDLVPARLAITQLNTLGAAE